MPKIWQKLTRLLPKTGFFALLILRFKKNAKIIYWKKVVKNRTQFWNQCGVNSARLFKKRAQKKWFFWTQKKNDIFFKGKMKQILTWVKKTVFFILEKNSLIFWKKMLVFDQKWRCFDIHLSNKSRQF